MQTSRIRFVAISAATLALIVAGTTAVAAHPGDRGDPYGWGEGPMGPMGQFGQRGDMRGPAWDGYGGGLGMAFEDLVRRETIYETADGLVTQRMDNGTVSSIGESAIDYTLANGETATVSTDADTQVIAFSEQTVQLGRRGLSQQRMVPETIAIADIGAGSEVVVWAQSQEDGTFLAQRVVVQPMDDATAEDTDAADGTDTGTSEDAAAAADA